MTTNTTLNSALASLSGLLRQQPDVATVAVSRSELDAVVGKILNDERRRKESHEKSDQNLKFMARISPHVLNFMSPILRGPRSLSLTTDHWLSYGGVSVTRSAAGGCIVAATNGRTIAIAYDAEASLATPDGVQEMRFTLPDCILDACRPPSAPKLIPPGGEPEEIPEGICDLMVPDMVFASGAGIFVCPVGNPSEYSGCDEDGCDEWPEGGVLATSHISTRELSDNRYCIMETRGKGNIVNATLPILARALAQKNLKPISDVGIGSDATGQMTDCMARILEWEHFNPHRVNKGQKEPEPCGIYYSNLGWQMGACPPHNDDPLRSPMIIYTHGSGRYALIQCGFRLAKMPDTPKEDWFTPEANDFKAAQEGE
ncbi:hypothetical protein predicted by Glimmer/Critica [Acetobacter senegalensis]|uniref:Uncharacterized protein n=1 Tax=Acetobacter senegalensis TaxID=446692 RepID=A0A0U5ETP5_9PROT|nr:hypothetical protein [Acetobacter senegalensis]CEF41082.1 hypothetical protein predicted by Glimmer/Critica [Acetobacter senegalensis]